MFLGTETERYIYVPGNGYREVYTCSWEWIQRGIYMFLGMNKERYMYMFLVINKERYIYVPGNRYREVYICPGNG